MSNIDQLSISKFSAMTKLSTKALRLYEKKGLLEPASVDPINNYRYYRLDQLEIGIKIKMLVTMGFGIDEMIAIMDAAFENENDLLHQLFNKRLVHIQSEIKRLEKIEEIMRTKKPMELLYMQCTEPELKHITKLRVISTREIGTYQDTIPELISRIFGEIYNPVNRQQVKLTGPIMFLSHDLEFKEENADIEIAVPISGRISISTNEIELKNFDETDVISVIYTGAYSDVGIGYTKALEHVVKLGYNIQGPTREIYLNDPNEVPPEQLMTEIQIPIYRKD